jgi:hypothetical protein
MAKGGHDGHLANYHAQDEGSCWHFGDYGHELRQQLGSPPEHKKQASDPGGDFHAKPLFPGLARPG